jgi:hypothetical protein
MRLEVIADDVYFEPWSSEFNVKTNKKVNVVVSEQIEEKPKLRVQVMEQEEIKVSEPVVKKPQVEKSQFTKQQILDRLRNK